MVVWGWCDPIQVSFLSLEFLKKLLQMALGAVPKIDFRDEKMRECIDNLRQMINSDTDTEIVRGPLGLARNEYSGRPCWVPFPIWTNYCLGHDSFVTKLNTLHTAEELSKVGFWSANIFSALATEPVTIFIGNWIKFKISSEGVALSRAWSCPLYIRHFSVDTACHLATGLKGPICIDCTPLSLRGGSVNWINPPNPGWPDGHSSRVDNLFTPKYCLFWSLSAWFFHISGWRNTVHSLCGGEPRPTCLTWNDESSFFSRSPDEALNAFDS